MKPLILTTGEPAGIGPDICIQLASYLAAENIVLCGDIELLRQRAKQHGKTIEFYPIEEKNRYRGNQGGDTAIAVHHTPCYQPVCIGKLNINNAQYVLDTLTIAAQNCLQGTYSGIVTAPIHKGVICDSGINFSGHTEFFAEQTQTKLPVMVLATEKLKVGLVTTHLPLKSVPAAITKERLSNILMIIERDMKNYFSAGKSPKIGICGLNPHAGEDGHMGDEEINIINPTLDKLRQQGLKVSKALPADTLFVPHHVDNYDIVVAMYHDQGLPVIKSHGFGQCVNLTFGLPIIRTSVDHGTALELAGTNKANCNSLKCAVEMAKKMVYHQQQKTSTKTASK